EAIRNHEGFEERIFDDLQNSKTIAMLGLEILSVNILGISPTPEMARALETQTRETLQKEADEAIYERRNFAVEQERMIKESELNTEIAVEEKQKQIAQKEMETKVVKQENDQRLRSMKMKADQQLEEDKQKLIDLQVKNQMKEADAREYILNANLKPYADLDWRTLIAINGNGMKAGDHIAMAFRELAENADKIGNLNITPDLLQQLVTVKN
ncbi:MAG TPA: membrane protease subunit, stomatin/prohibitin, partial [Cryomorphaceae bacterium]|nr:membrane protease subunit, stomatin/prohibitin [Cryomorphaceae bacterium]